MSDNATIILKIINDITGSRKVNKITLDSRLKQDLGFDSLTMLEMCVEIEGVFKTSISEKLSGIRTIKDIVFLIENGSGTNETSYNIEDYPLQKTKKHIWRLKSLMRLSHLLWRLEVSGLANLPTDESYIICPNHQSHFDSLWIWTAIGNKQANLSKICCLAKQEHLNSKSSLFMLALLGGIPVERSGNTVPAMKRGLECLNDGYTMLIHPEGTRTLDGKIQEFKNGAAKLAIDASVPLIPVRIDGAWDIFPPHRKRPKIFRLGRRYPIKISFGKPINPNGKSVEELTAQLQNEVEQMGERK